jgi:hypothetical protein
MWLLPTHDRPVQHDGLDAPGLSRTAPKESYGEGACSYADDNNHSANGPPRCARFRRQ